MQRITDQERKAATDMAAGMIGKRWVAGANGPDVFDCWGLVLYARRQLFGCDLPDLERPPVALSLPQAREAFASATKPLGWYQIERPVHGAICLMGMTGVPSHAGIYLAIPPGPGAVLHCDESSGVRFETPPALEHRGWTKFRWYTKGGGE